MSGERVAGAICCFTGREIAGDEAIPIWVPIGPLPEHVQTFFTTRENLIAAFHPSVEVDFGIYDED